jgi:hypothetical protein
VSQGALVLVEPGAHQAGGHRHHTLIAPAAAHNTRDGAVFTVVTSDVIQRYPAGREV